MLAVSSRFYGRQGVVGKDVARTRAVAQFADRVVHFVWRLVFRVRARFEVAGMTCRTIRCVFGVSPRRRLVVADMAIRANGCVMACGNCPGGVRIAHRPPRRCQVTFITFQRGDEVSIGLAGRLRAVMATGAAARDFVVIQPD